MNFWANAFVWGWCDVLLLKKVVKTDNNPFGEISKEEFKSITGEAYEEKEEEEYEEESAE